VSRWLAECLALPYTSGLQPLPGRRLKIENKSIRERGSGCKPEPTQAIQSLQFSQFSSVQRFQHVFSRTVVSGPPIQTRFEKYRNARQAVAALHTEVVAIGASMWYIKSIFDNNPELETSRFCGDSGLCWSAPFTWLGAHTARPPPRLPWCQ